MILSDYKIPLIAGGAFLVGVTLGAFAGAKIVEKKLIEELDEQLGKETELIRSFQDTFDKDKYPTPADAVRDLIPDSTVEAMVAYQGKTGRPAEPKVAYHKINHVDGYSDPEEEHALEAEFGAEALEQFEMVRKNVFEASEEVLGDIRVISEEEFTQNESDFLQNTLTYYTDGVLADEKENKIDDITKTVGDALENFGGISNDENVVYVQNTVLSLEFEIVKSDKTFNEEVFGMEPEVPIVRPSARIRAQGG